MKKTNVLKENRSFDEVINKGKKVSNPHYSLFYLNTEELETFKVGISVGKKTGNAPFRNRQKRIIRAIIDQLAPTIKPKNYVIISRKSACKLTYAEQYASVKMLFERVK